MYVNDLKKGTRVVLASGWEATLMDSKKGVTRMAKVEGDFTETASVYAHDIVGYCDPTSPTGWGPVEYSESQIKCRATARRFEMV